MKTLIIATAMVAGLSTASFAEGLSFGGAAEYQVEAEKFETTIGTRYAMGDITFSPSVTASYTNADKFTIDGVDFTASYTLTENLAVYGKVEADKDFKYEEATVGVAFNF
jgi:hypothetical protein